ncbi:MAG: transcriptional repressor LexA, partial [Clostridia bacterium]
MARQVSSQISPKQEQILEFIKNYVRECGFAPSVREICTGVGLSSPSSGHGHLKALERKGFIRRTDCKTRAIVLVSDEENRKNITQVPILGRVAAGAPILAIEQIEGYIPFVDANEGYDYFALRVRGDSMINAGILPDDLIIVRKQETAESGEIVVALIGEEATVKRLS